MNLSSSEDGREIMLINAPDSFAARFYSFDGAKKIENPPHFDLLGCIHLIVDRISTFRIRLSEKVSVAFRPRIPCPIGCRINNVET